MCLFHPVTLNKGLLLPVRHMHVTEEYPSRVICVAEPLAWKEKGNSCWQLEKILHFGWNMCLSSDHEIARNPSHAVIAENLMRKKHPGTSWEPEPHPCLPPTVSPSLLPSSTPQAAQRLISWQQCSSRAVLKIHLWNSLWIQQSLLMHGGTFQAPQWMLKTQIVPNHIHAIFSYTYIPMKSLVYERGTVRD
jgi:hypothetical protein